MAFSSKKHHDYKDTIEGHWGTFTAPSGTVSFLMTKARLGIGGIDPTRRLTKHLRPVREILDTSVLDFNQLLQRDLDDHRIATELIPYILSQQSLGPAFFPPIVAVLLPFDAYERIDTFPPAQKPDVLAGTYDSLYSVVAHGDAYKVERLWDEDKNDFHDLTLGRLLWNDENAKLVVIDGQHRAMALLAIERTLNKTWLGSSGEKFRYFYEHRVRELVKDDSGAVINNLEFPVTICWFEDTSHPHEAARKLFVDLNKNARPPSEARLILLSDSELTNVFARSMLNQLRSDSDSLPIYAVEYDNPEAEYYQPVRWSVLTNLNLLKYAVRYTVFCPDKLIRVKDARFGGRLPESDMDARMRSQLDLASFMPETVDDGKIIERSDVGNKYFPKSYRSELEDTFRLGWGSAIIHLLSSILPYQCHWRALKKMKEDWTPGDSVSSLAHEALFSGMGMYWTLRDSHEHWRQQVREANAQKAQPPTKPDIAGAWEALEMKKADFETRRCVEYTGSSGENRIQECNDMFEDMNTHACQLGVMLTLTTIAEDNAVSGPSLNNLAVVLVQSWNAALTYNVVQSRDRRMIMSRRISKPLNRIGKMDTPLAVHFRYFWLELLCTNEARVIHAGHIDADKLISRRDNSRSNYYQYLINEQKKAFERLNPDWSPAKISKAATESATKDLRASLKFWLLISDDEYSGWLQALSSPQVEYTDSPPPEVETADEDAEVEGGDEYDQILRDLT
jgi:hypothetical protein